jgi:hypothetical protein
VRSETLTDVSQRLLAEHGRLHGLFHMKLGRIRGLSDAKAVQLHSGHCLPILVVARPADKRRRGVAIV